MESIQVVPVAVVDRIVSRNVFVDCTGSIGSCCRQYFRSNVCGVYTSRPGGC